MRAAPAGGINWRSCLRKALAASAAVGSLSGFIIVPALLLLRLTTTEAVAIYLVSVVINAASSLAAHARVAADLDCTVIAVFATASMATSLTDRPHRRQDS